MACSGVMPSMDVSERISFKHPDYLATFGKLDTSVIGAGRKCTSCIPYLLLIDDNTLHLDSRESLQYLVVSHKS